MHIFRSCLAAAKLLLVSLYVMNMGIDALIYTCALVLVCGWES